MKKIPAILALVLGTLPGAVRAQEAVRELDVAVGGDGLFVSDGGVNRVVVFELP